MTQAASLLDALKQDCIDAWGLTDAKVHYGQVRVQNPDATYAIIDLMPVEMGPHAVRTVVQKYSFRITGRFPFPDSGNILLAKIAKANELIAQIITGPNYNSIAFLPYVTSFDPTEEDDPQAAFYEFSIVFECQVEEDHH